MSEFDDLFEKEPKQELITEDPGIEGFYRHANNQSKNGLLLAIYVGIMILFSFANEIIVSMIYPDVDAILDNIVVVDEPNITVSENPDENYPYLLTLTGTLLNNSDVDFPVMWVDVEFFDENGESYGIYTYTENEILAGASMSFDEGIEATFEPASYEIYYGFDESSMFYTILGVLPIFVSAVLFLLVDREAFKFDWIRFKKEWKTNVGQIVSGFIMVYAALIIAQLILDSLGVSGTSQNEMTIQSLFSDNPLQLLMLFLLLCVFTPIVEEVVFRKVIYNFVEPKSNHWIAIIVTGAIFGLMHVLSYGDFIQSIPYIFMGLTFGYIYYRSQKNIFVVMGVHFANNFLSFVIYVLMVYGIYSI